MFAAIYFAQVVFAGLPLITVTPPPPPPPPPPPIVVQAEICQKFAIGDCIGTPGPTARVPRRGTASCVPGARAIGSANRGGIGPKIGSEGGQCP